MRRLKWGVAILRLSVGSIRCRYRQTLLLQTLEAKAHKEALFRFIAKVQTLSITYQAAVVLGTLQAA
jgi:hypothetical protein